MCCFFMSFCIKKYKNILIFIFLGGINMAVKTGVSMISIAITKEMRYSIFLCLYIFLYIKKHKNNIYISPVGWYNINR